MPQLKIMGFDGLVPRMSATMLADNQAQIAENVKLYSHELRYWRGEKLSYSPSSTGIQTIWRYYTSDPDPYWLTWTSEVDVVTSPTTDLTDYRIYFTGSGAPKKATKTMVTTGTGDYPRSSINMGVPAPTGAPTNTANRTGTTVTISIATPGVVTQTAHGYTNGQEVQFSTTGALPTGITAGNKYYTRNVTTDTYELGVTSSATTSVATSGTQSGVHTAYKNSGLESRVYIYTYVSTFGSVQEESAPSPASSIVNVYTGDSVTVGGFATAPTTGYNITSRRIYRSVSGATADSYQFVAEIPIATTSYTDTKTAAQLGENISTIGWAEPPTDLKGLIVLPTGALAGFSGNTVYFSEPYYPHAWPTAYALTVPHKIVGLGIYATSVVVMTERYPYIISGGIPGVMSVERIPTLEPCVAKSSIVSGEMGVMYASPNGLIAIGPSERGCITNNLFRRDEWQAIYPALIKAALYDGKYVALYTSSAYESFLLSPDDKPALSKFYPQGNAVHVDSKTGTLFYLKESDNKIYQADADDLNPVYYQWHSKRFVLPQATSFSALKLDGDFSQADLASIYQQQVADIIAYNQALFAAGTPLNGVLNATTLNYYPVDGSAMKVIPPAASSRTAQVKIFGDGVLQTTLTITSFNPVRIPPFKSREIEIEIVGNMNVRSIALATTVPELHQ